MASEKMKKAGLIICLLMVAEIVSAQTIFPFASKSNRDSVTVKLKDQIHQTIKLPLNDSTSQKWMGAFWAMELMLYKPAGYEEKISLQLSRLSQMGPGFQRAFFEMLYTLYPKEFDVEVHPIVKQLKSDKVKAMALEYLALSGKSAFIDPSDKFLQSEYYLHYKYMRSKTQQPLPSKKDFLDTSFLPNQTVLCSFQSTSRNIPGYLMIRLADGTWMKNEKGEELKFPQLARAISNLPFYLTNGNTPQGLYKITGVDTSDNNWIGPTTNLQMVMPYENNSSEFFGTATAYEAHYNNLLGTHLQQFIGLKESYWAGKIGRTEIIAHGTTINPEYYKQQTYYPNTPSLGCLCSPETWNEKGECTYSAQAQWMNYILKPEQLPSYLIVAEVIDL
ncbi:MAG: hypothetical protein K2X48_14080 [Chitinophagaceae bacterium]|nr:hypothetical protein [Chitinophagaceae bacterium]